MNEKRLILGNISKNSEQKAKEKYFKASRLGRYWERLVIKSEKSEWYLNSQQQDYKKEDRGVIPFKFLEVIFIL